MGDHDESDTTAGNLEDQDPHRQRDRVNTAIEAGSPAAEWKNTLSGALSDMQLYLALVVLFVFYVVYTLYNAWHSLDRNSDEQDEGEIIHSCVCEKAHRIFYFILIIACCIVWFIFQSCYTLYILSSPDTQKSIDQKFAKFETKLLCKAYDNPDSACEFDQKIVQYADKLLHRRHYEMYAIGMQKTNKSTFDQITKLLAKKESQLQGQGSSEGGFQEGTDHANLPHEDNSKKRGKEIGSQHIILGVFHVFLRIALFLVQLSVVPLLIFQMFDTYTLLCLGARNYCDTESQYKLHLDQAALSFSFYCALMISLLVTKWLILIPSPCKLEDLANCCKQCITDS